MQVPTVETRSIKALNERHPECDSAFMAGVSAVFGQWTALELALFHQWGGPEAGSNIDYLKSDLLAMFTGHEKIYKDDVSILLEDFLDQNFNTVCEDGSPDEIGELFVNLWRSCCEGDFTMVNSLIEKEQVRNANMEKIHQVSQGVGAKGDALDSDDEDEGGITMAEAMREAGYNEEGEKIAAPPSVFTMPLPTVEAGGMMTATMNQEDPDAAMDEDGWETVVVGKARKSKGKR